MAEQSDISTFNIRQCPTCGTPHNPNDIVFSWPDIPPAVRAELEAARRVLIDEYRPHWEARGHAAERLRRLLETTP